MSGTAYLGYVDLYPRCGKFLGASYKAAADLRYWYASDYACMDLLIIEPVFITRDEAVRVQKGEARRARCSSTI